jgi:hypothetical protein
MTYHYVWLAWSSGFLLPWLALYVTNPSFRPVMWRVSLVTAAFGLTEPIFVPEYWNPPSLFELAQRTGFDIESLIFSFAIGGIGAVATRQRQPDADLSGSQPLGARPPVQRVAPAAPAGAGARDP